MFGYYAELAVHGFRRGPRLTALMAIIMAVGVAASADFFPIRAVVRIRQWLAR